LKTKLQRAGSCFFAGFGENLYGDIYRAKGVFQTAQSEWFTCEYIPGEMVIKPMKTGTGAGADKLRICVIGLCLNSGKMRNALIDEVH